MGVFLGVDVGTSSTKGVLVDLAGTVLASTVREHEVSRPHPGWVEMDAGVWWDEFVSISRELAHRMVTDPGGEPIVVAASALQMSAAVLQRILLCINPVISQSIQLVYDLALLHEDLKAASALRMIAIWQAAHRPDDKPGVDSKSETAPPPTAVQHEPQRAVEQRTVDQRRMAFSTVRPKILWDQHAKARKA